MYAESPLKQCSSRIDQLNKVKKNSRERPTSSEKKRRKRTQLGKNNKETFGFYKFNNKNLNSELYTYTFCYHFLKEPKNAVNVFHGYWRKGSNSNEKNHCTEIAEYISRTNH